MSEEVEIMLNKLFWYQCDIIERDYSVVFWCRFKASSRKEAIWNITSNIYHIPEIKTALNKTIKKKNVINFIVNRVPTSVLSKYNLSNMFEVESFLVKERG